MTTTTDHGTATPPLRRTPLYALHQQLGGRLVEFGGYAMPLQYGDSIREEHLHTRAHAGLFDVSHMGQINVAGPPAALENLVTGDIDGLADYQQRYTLLTNDNGGIIDDLMVTRLPDRLHLVVNAAYRDSDLHHLETGLAGLCTVSAQAERALLALQGPQAAEVIAAFEPALATIAFMSSLACRLDGIPCLVSRSGYCGEDGYEISLPGDAAETLARALLDDARVKPIGLGARDSLRLEAGLCLAGSDITAQTSPAEAGLGWTIAKKYRDLPAVAARFPGATRILAELRSGPARKRVGLRPKSGVPLRAEMILHDHDGREVGAVSSGSFGATLGHPVAMGYVLSDLAAPGTRLGVTIRARSHTVDVVALPFVRHRYFR